MSSRIAEGGTNPADGLSKQLEWVDSVLELSLAERHFKNQVIIEQSIILQSSAQPFYCNLTIQWLRVSCVVQIGAGFKKTKEIHVRQYGTGGRSAHHNPSAVVGPNGSRTSGSSAGDIQPSMAKIAGEWQVIRSSVDIVSLSNDRRYIIRDHLSPHQLRELTAAWRSSLSRTGDLGLPFFTLS